MASERSGSPDHILRPRPRKVVALGEALRPNGHGTNGTIEIPSSGVSR